MLREAGRKVGELGAGGSEASWDSATRSWRMRQRIRIKQPHSFRLEDEDQKNRQVTGVLLHLTQVILALAFLWYVITK